MRPQPRPTLGPQARERPAAGDPGPAASESLAHRRSATKLSCRLVSQQQVTSTHLCIRFMRAHAFERKESLAGVPSIWDSVPAGQTRRVASSEAPRRDAKPAQDRHAPSALLSPGPPPQAALGTRPLTHSCSRLLKGPSTVTVAGGLGGDRAPTGTAYLCRPAPLGGSRLQQSACGTISRENTCNP